MPFPLIAAALAAAGNLGSAFMNKNAAGQVAGTSRRAGNLASQASLKAGSMGASASKRAANVGATAATQAAGVGATAAQQAAHQQVAGYNNAIDQTRAGTAQSIGYLQPFAQAGQGGSKLLSDAFGINGPDAQKAYYAGFQTDPGYEATLRGGTQALDQGAASVGNLRSGGAMKDQFSYGQQQMQGQFQDRLTRLLGVSSQGQNAATTMGGYSQQGSQDIANYLAQQGGALGQGTINAGNATMGGITGAADWNSGGILGAANSNISGFLGATNARTNAMQNSSWLNQYGAGQMAGVANDLAGKFSSPLSQYAGKAASSFHAPTSGLVF